MDRPAFHGQAAEVKFPPLAEVNGGTFCRSAASLWKMRRGFAIIAFSSYWRRNE